MKAPEQTPHTPERGAQNINYSMLPPERLPNWLLEKNTPAKVYNYSMHPPGTQPRGVEYRQEKELTSREMQPPPLSMQPVVAEPAVVENVPVAPESAATTPEMPYSAPQMTDTVASVAQNNSGDTTETIITIINESTPYADTPIPADNAPAKNDGIQPDPDSPKDYPQPLESSPVVDLVIDADRKTPINVDVPEHNGEPVIHWQAPAPAIQPDREMAQPIPAEPIRAPQPVSQQEYPANTTQPASKSFGDWIINNSNASMMIVVGVIIFSVVIIILVFMGVV